MIQIIYYILFGIFFVLLFIKQKEFIFLIPIFNIIVDTSFTFFPGFSAPTILRALVIILFLLYSFRNYSRYLSLKIERLIYIFIFYVLILTFISSEFLYSLKVSVQVILSFLMFLAAYRFFKKWTQYYKLLVQLSWILFFSVIVTLVGYIFGIGRVLEYSMFYDYGGGPEVVGLLGSSGQYTPATIIALFPLFTDKIFPKAKRWVILILMVINYVFIILNVRRTAILIPIIGSIAFVLFAKYRANYLKYLLLGAIAIIIAFPLYRQLLEKRVEVRAVRGRFEPDFYKSEARYLENEEIFNSIVEFKNPFRILFGIGNNIFAEAYKNGEVVRRMYHSDSAKLLYGVGIVGFMLYIFIYYKLFKVIINIPKNEVLVPLKSGALSMLLIQIFASINGSITIITFRVITFLIMGAFLGLAHSIIEKKRFSTGHKTKK